MQNVGHGRDNNVQITIIFSDVKKKNCFNFINKYFNMQNIYFKLFITKNITMCHFKHIINNVEFMTLSSI